MVVHVQRGANGWKSVVGIYVVWMAIFERPMYIYLPRESCLRVYPLTFPPPRVSSPQRPLYPASAPHLLGAYSPFLAAATFFAASLACFSLLAICASTPIPPNTSPTPSHCICDRLWPNATTLRIMVNILRVTVTVTSRTEENVESVWTGT